MSIYYEQGRFPSDSCMATSCNACLFTWGEVGYG